MSGHPIQSPVGDLRKAYLADKAKVFDDISQLQLKSRGIDRHLKLLSGLTDDLLGKLWARQRFPSDMGLIAVGGYGRGELLPYSDIDVLILINELSDEVKVKLESFIGECWDAGLDIGSSVRTLNECITEAEADITVRTAMLESRPLHIDADTYRSWKSQVLATLDSKAFFTAKMLEMRQRHQRQENTPYSLEPNCKESPGGLRDLQVLLWVAQAAQLGTSWDGLGRHGMATPHEVKQLKANEAQLLLIRARLHILAKRREDRLVFDMQQQLAASFGLEATVTSGGKLARRASETLMRMYYWSAKAVTQLNQILLLNIENHLKGIVLPTDEQRTWINPGFFEHNGLLEVAREDLFIHEPERILETFWLFQNMPGCHGLSARTLRALYNARGRMNGDFRKDPRNREWFMRIVQSPNGITKVTRLMNQTSVLGRYLWVFRNIVGQMQHDLFHVYTVDQHILMVLRNVRRFFMEEHSHEYPFCSQLAAGWGKPWVLYLAALFHDIAKGRGGDHSALGKKDVLAFCRAHHIATEDAQLLVFLVGEHLTMSHIAQKEDLSDPDVIHAFAQRVGSEQYLTGLYLLTVADIRGTSPKVWNSWKGKLLEDLYRMTRNALGGGAPAPETMVESRKRDALAELARLALPFEAHKRVWDQVSVGYFMRHTADEIAWHTRQLSKPLAQQSPDAPPLTLVRARKVPNAEGLQVMVFTPDVKDLFERICGFFDSSDFSIVDAKIYTTRTGQALDTFIVIAPGLAEHYAQLADMIQAQLHQALTTQAPLPAPSRARLSRRVKSFPVTPRVNLQPDEKCMKWILSVSSSDFTGLLYRIAKVLSKHGLSLEMAKITTLGERVEDTFLVKGEALHYNQSQLALETDLLNMLESQTS